MRLFVFGLAISVACCLGCRRASAPSSDPSILYSTGSDTVAGVEWSYALVADKATGKLRYIAVVYGRGILAGIQPSRNSVPVDGKMVACAFHRRVAFRD